MDFIAFDRHFTIQSPIKVLGLPTVDTWGITNRTSDNQWLLFLDYDDVEYDVVRDDVKFLQDTFSYLGPAMVRVSSIKTYKECELGSYHVVFFSKLTFREVEDMLRLVRCDQHFKHGCKYQSRCWVLRIGEKRDLKTGKIKKPETLFKEIIVGHGNETCESFTGLVRFFEVMDENNYRWIQNIPDRTEIKDVEFIKYPTR